MSQIPIVNFDKLITDKEKPAFCKNGDLLPHNARMLIISPSAGGKTNLLFYLVFAENGLRFKHIYLFSKSLYQSKYVFLKKVFAGLKNIGFHMKEDVNQIPHPNRIPEYSLVIFDDFDMINHMFSLSLIHS